MKSNKAIFVIYSISGLAVMASCFALSIFTGTLRTLFEYLPYAVTIAVAAKSYFNRKLIPFLGFIFGVFFVPRVLIVMSLFGPVLKDRLSRIEFHSEEWKRVQIYTDPIRITMVDDLISKGILIGLKRQKVVELLGAPNLSAKSEKYYDYWLGPARTIGPAYWEWLEVKFEEDVTLRATIKRR